MQVQDALRQLRERKRLLDDNIQRGTNMTIESSVPPFVSLSLGSAFFRLGRIAEAEREYKATIAADPKSGEAHSNLAVVYMETGRYAEAEASVAAAERVGFKVNVQLKQEIKERMKKQS
jgi:tetratricopeptide (TPR) repeat protein